MESRDDTSTAAGVGEIALGPAGGLENTGAAADDTGRPLGATGVVSGGSVAGPVRSGSVGEGPTGSRMGGGPGSGGPGGGVGPRAAPPMSNAATSDFT
ncbi:hypothetical protein [Dactylosporangium sp. NPDC051541]|uniref:hypothetical protein n=1 Tax=Dactylosporangium sp. NPDC051541 TaxID=3363977 RepID=UPI0037AFB52B